MEDVVAGAGEQADVVAGGERAGDAGGLQGGGQALVEGHLVGAAGAGQAATGEQDRAQPRPAVAHPHHGDGEAGDHPRVGAADHPFLQQGIGPGDTAGAADGAELGVVEAGLLGGADVELGVAGTLLLGLLGLAVERREGELQSRHRGDAKGDRHRGEQRPQRPGTQAAQDDRPQARHRFCSASLARF